MKVAVYLRISRKDEEEILKNQRRAALEYVTNHGWDLVREPYEDTASGGDDDREGLNELIADANRRKFDLVVFTALSRMTRGGIGAALYILGRLEQAGVGWVFIEQPILNYDSNTPKLAKDIILSVLAAVDEDYRRRISQATKVALARRKALGVRLGRHRSGCTCSRHRKPALRAPKTVPPSTTGGDVA